MIYQDQSKLNTIEPSIENKHGQYSNNNNVGLRINKVAS
jgi:hypothetical protein